MVSDFHAARRVAPVGGRFWRLCTFCRILSKFATPILRRFKIEFRFYYLGLGKGTVAIEGNNIIGIAMLLVPEEAPGARVPPTPAKTYVVYKNSAKSRGATKPKTVISILRGAHRGFEKRKRGTPGPYADAKMGSGLH